MEHHDATVIGAGPAGLAVGACLKREGLSPVLLERASSVGSTWRGHYERLHLHSDRRHSELPYLGFPRGTPRYPSRRQVVDYLDAYAAHFDLCVRFGREAEGIRRAEDGAGWVVTTASGDLLHIHRGGGGERVQRDSQSSQLARGRGFRRRDHSQRRVPKRRAVSWSADSGGRFRKFRGRDRHRPARTRRSSHPGGSRPGQRGSPGFARHPDSDLGDRPECFAAPT